MSESYPDWQKKITTSHSQHNAFINKFSFPNSKVCNLPAQQFENKFSQNPASFSNRLNVHQKRNNFCSLSESDCFGGNWHANSASNANPQHVTIESVTRSIGRNIMFATNSANYVNVVSNVNSFMNRNTIQISMNTKHPPSVPVGPFQQDGDFNRQIFNSWEGHPKQRNDYNQWNVNQLGNSISYEVNWNCAQPHNRNSENFPLGNISQNGWNNGTHSLRQQWSPNQHKKFRKDKPNVDHSKTPREKEVLKGFMTLVPDGTSPNIAVRIINAQLHQQFGYTGPVVRYGHISSNHHVLIFPTEQVLQLAVHNMSPLKVEGSIAHLTMCMPPHNSKGKQELLKSKQKPSTNVISDDIIELEPMEGNDFDVRNCPNSTNNHNKVKSKTKSGSGSKSKIYPRPRGVFPEAVQPLTLVLVVDETVPYLSLHQLKQKGYKILSGKNLDALGFLELIRNDQSFNDDGVLYVIIPFLYFCLHHLNLFVMEEMSFPTNSDSPSSSTKDSNPNMEGSELQSSDSASLLTIVKDFSSEISPVDLDVLASCGGGLSGIDAERDRSRDEPLYAERLLTARLLHSAMRLRAGVRDASLNSELVFCGFPSHAMQTAGIERCFKHKGSVKQLGQISSALLTALRAFNEFAANTWKLGYISKIPSFNLAPEEFWGEETLDGRRRREKEDASSDVEILAETSASGARGRRLTRGRRAKVRVTSEVITLGDDETTCFSESKRTSNDQDESVSVAGAAPDDRQMECLVSPEDPTMDIQSNKAANTTDESPHSNGDGPRVCEWPKESTTNKMNMSCELEDITGNIVGSEDRIIVPDDADEVLEHDVLFIDNTEKFDDLPMDENELLMDNNPDESVGDVRGQYCKGLNAAAYNSTNLASSTSGNYIANDTKNSSTGNAIGPCSNHLQDSKTELVDAEEIGEASDDEDDSSADPVVEGVLPLSRLGRHRWFGAAVSRGGDGRCFNRSLERATHWYMGVLFRLLDLSSKLMDKRGSFLPWLPPSASPPDPSGAKAGAVATSVEAAVYRECQSLADDEENDVPVSYCCVLCDVDLQDVETADKHAYTLDHCALLKKRSNDLPLVSVSQLLGKVPLQGSRGLSQEFLERLERAHMLQSVPSTSAPHWRCLACDGQTLYDANRLRHHVHDLHHRALTNVRLGLTKARQRALPHEHWTLVKTRLRRHPDLSVIFIADDMNYSVLQSLTRLHDRIQVWTFNNLLRDPSGRASALARWKEMSGGGGEPGVLWLLVTGIDLLVTTKEAQETPNVDQILDHVYSLHSFLRINLPPSHIVLTTPVLPLNILVDTLPRNLTSSLMNASNSIIVSEDEVKTIRRPYELLFSRSLALHAANAAHENVHRLAKSAVSSCVVRVLVPHDLSPKALALPHYFMSSPWHVAVEGLATAAVYGLPAPYLRRCHDATVAGINLHDMEEEPRLSRAVVVGDIKWSAQSPLAKRRLSGRKRRLEFNAADLAYVLEYAEPAPHNPVTWCLTAPVPGAFMRSLPNPACVTNRCKKGLRTWLYLSPQVDGNTAACNMRTFLTKLQSKLPRGNFANVFPIFPTNIITYIRPDRLTHDAIHEFYEQFPNTYFTREPEERVQESIKQLKTSWSKLFLSNKLGHTLQVEDSFACINVFPITEQVDKVRKTVVQQAEDWLTTVNAYFTDFSPLISVLLAEDAIREPTNALASVLPGHDASPQPIQLE